MNRSVAYARSSVDLILVPHPTEGGAGRVMTSSAMSKQIGEAAFGAAEIGDAEPHQQDDHPEAEDDAGEVEPTVAAEHAPAKAIDDPDHRVEAVPEAPLLRHDRARKPDWRHVEP
jgi:hypothetical protein